MHHKPASIFAIALAFGVLAVAAPTADAKTVQPNPAAHNQLCEDLRNIMVTNESEHTKEGHIVALKAAGDYNKQGCNASISGATKQ